MALGPVGGAGILLGIAVGAGATLFGPALWRAARPYAKSALHAAMDGIDAAQTAAARAAEHVEDLLAEVAHERKAAAAPEPEEDTIAVTRGEDAASRG